jgi:putative acetyltransferase
MRIVQGGLDDQQVIDMLRFHFDTNHAITPPESVHVFDISRLKEPDVFFYSAWDGETLLGVGAFKILTPTHGEVKSMHTNRALRRSGTGAAIMLHLIDEARARGLKRLSLETGSFDYFAPARALYAKYGFTECAPFGDYKPDPNSTFMTREI